MANATRRVPQTLEPTLTMILSEADDALARKDWPRLLQVLRAGSSEIAAATGRTVRITAANISSDRDTRHSGTLQSGIAVLALFEEDPDRIYALREVSQRLGITPSSTHRYLQTLVAVGQLEQPVGTQQYRRVLHEEES